MAFPNARTCKNSAKNLFSGERQSGFAIDRVRDTFLEARFIERFEFSEALIDPWGRELKSDRVEFCQTRFIASSQNMGLEILDSNKGARSFVSSLSAVCDDNLALSALSVDPAMWAETFRQMHDKEFYYDSIQLKDLTISPTVRAKIVLAGSVDVRSALSEFVGKRSYSVEKLRLSTFSRPRISVLLTNNGSAATVGKEDEVLIETIRRSLASAISL